MADTSYFLYYRVTEIKKKKEKYKKRKEERTYLHPFLSNERRIKLGVRNFYREHFKGKKDVLWIKCHL